MVEKSKVSTGIIKTDFIQVNWVAFLYYALIFSLVCDFLWWVIPGFVSIYYVIIDFFKGYQSSVMLKGHKNLYVFRAAITILSIILTIIKLFATAVQFKLKLEIATDEIDGKHNFFIP